MLWTSTDPKPGPELPSGHSPTKSQDREMASAQDPPTDEDETITPENLVKSKQRVADHGEVFTPKTAQLWSL